MTIKFGLVRASKKLAMYHYTLDPYAQSTYLIINYTKLINYVIIEKSKNM